MIKNCLYREDEFEIQFEWPLSREVVANSPELAEFIDLIRTTEGTRFIENGDDILGLVIPYQAWKRLLSEKKPSERSIQLSEEFSNFFHTNTLGSNE